MTARCGRCGAEFPADCHGEECGGFDCISCHDREDRDACVASHCRLCGAEVAPDAFDRRCAGCVPDPFDAPAPPVEQPWPR